MLTRKFEIKFWRPAVAILASILFSFLAFTSATSLGEGPPLLWFIPAVIITAYFFGLGPGLMSTIISSLIAVYFGLKPIGSFAITSKNDEIRLVVFFLIGTTVSFLMESLHRARRKAILAEKEKEDLCRRLQEEAQQRKSVEDVLRQKQADLNLIFSAVPAAILYIDSERKYRFCNDTFAAWSGRSIDQIIGRSVSEVVEKENLSIICQQLDAAFKGKRISYEELLTRSNQNRNVHVDIIPDFDNTNRVIGCIVLKYDVSKHVQLEKNLEIAKQEAESANRTKSIFLASMSHEIRTPLASVLGFSALLSNPNVTKTNRLLWSEAISRNGDLLNQLISDILDFSKIEADKIEVEKSRVSLAEIMNDVLASARFKSEEKGIKINVKSQGAIPEWIHTDPVRLKQILLNLIGNSIKFTDKGGVDITIQQIHEGHSGQLKFLIQDTGCGITKEQERNLFAPFSQGDASIGRRFGGTGLGLMLSQRLTEKLGGCLRLESSELGKGTVFSVSIDMGELDVMSGNYLDSRPSRKHRNPLLTDTKSLRGIKILLAEDTPDIQLLVATCLEALGASIVTVDNGAKAVDMAMHGTFDLVLMDIQMPIKDGFEAVTELRKNGFEAPIFALTAHAMKEEQSRFRSCGFNDCLTKPLDFGKLVEKVRELPSIKTPLEMSQASVITGYNTESPPL